MPIQKFTNLTALGHHVVAIRGYNAAERLRDLAVLIFRKMAMRHTGSHFERTGFESLDYDELHSTFYHMVNEMVDRIPH